MSAFYREKKRRQRQVPTNLHAVTAQKKAALIFTTLKPQKHISELSPYG
jgi:hypothetical protein